MTDRDRSTDGDLVAARPAADTLVVLPAEEATAGLAALARRLRDTGVLRFELGARYGDGWRSLDAVVAEAIAWQQALVRREGDARAAAAFVSAWIVSAPALVTGLPAVLAEVVPQLDASRVHVHRSDVDVLDGHAIDPAAVVSSGDVLATAAGTIASLATPLVAELCDRLPVGPVATWGALADTLASYALWAARRHGADERRTWGRTVRLLDRLADEAPLRARPELLTVAWSGGTTPMPVRGTCCLYYRTCSAAGTGDDRYCATCPLRSDADRAARLRAYLETTPRR